MTTYEALNLVIGASQCALIWYGLNQMRDASKNRDKALDDQRTALDALIERTAASSKSLEAMLERTAGNSKSLENQSKALEELIKGQEESRMAFRAFIERIR